MDKDTKPNTNCPECKTLLKISYEDRGNGKREEVAECPGCGYTEIC